LVGIVLKLNLTLPAMIIPLGLCFYCQQAQAQSVQSLPGASVGNPQRLYFGMPSPEIPNFTQPRQPDFQYAKPEPEFSQPDLSRSSERQKIAIKKIQVLGIKSIEFEQVKKIISQFEERSSTLDELKKGVVDEISRLYEKKGYITTIVFIPPQKIENGFLTIQVEEGFIEEIEFEEGRYFKDRAVEPYLGATRSGVLNIRDLQRSIRRINENPDLQVQAILRAGNEPGTMRVAIRPAEEHFFLHLTPYLDNQGRPTIGNNRLGFTITNNNTLGFGDASNASFSWNRHSWGNMSSYEMPLGRHGTKAGLSYAYNHFKFNRSTLGFSGSATLTTPSISQELLRTEKSTLTAELGFGFKNAGLQVEGFEINQDRIRTLTPALNYTSSDRWGRTLMRHELGIGLDLFNATLGSSDTTSRPGAGSQFCRYTTYLVRAQRLPWQTYGIFKIMGQITRNPLVSLEQFQIGGASTVRGYKQGLLLGDSGFATSAEWHIPLRVWPLPEQIKILKNQYNLRNNIELVAFADNGGVFGNGPKVNVNPLSNHNTNNAFLGSVGAGLRVNLTRLIAARLDLGVPYIRLRGDKTAAWFHFGFESRIF
jgi:hemolysin activation/secretion protein